MYFCYGIKNSSLEQGYEPSMTSNRRESQQIELKIPRDRIRQSLKRRDEDTHANAAVNTNKTPLANGLSFSQEQWQTQWQTFE